MKHHFESDLQRECWRMFCLCKPREHGLLYLNHQNAPSAKMQAILKGMGLVSGVADMTYLGGEVVTFIEFKYGRGKQSEAQVSWQKLVESHGYRYVIIRSVTEFCHLMNIQIAGA